MVSRLATWLLAEKTVIIKNSSVQFNKLHTYIDTRITVATITLHVLTIHTRAGQSLIMGGVICEKDLKRLGKSVPC